MKRTSLILLLTFLFVLFSAEEINYNDNYLITKNNVGKINIGMSVDSLYAKYDRNSTNLIDLFLEGMFSPAIEVFIDGKGEKTQPSLVAELSNEYFTINRIIIRDKRFRTNKNISVGSTLGEIRKYYEIKWIDFCEGNLCARVENIRVTFKLDISIVPKEWHKTREQNLIPDSAEVVSILMN
jgi:hypothetical protein